MIPCSCAQTRVDVDPGVRLVHAKGGMIPVDRGAGRVGSDRDDARARAMRSPTAGRSSSSPRARAGRPARRRSTSSASPSSTRIASRRAFRSRSIPACTGRGAGSCGSPARSASRCSTRSCRASDRNAFFAELEQQAGGRDRTAHRRGAARSRRAGRSHFESGAEPGLISLAGGLILTFGGRMLGRGHSARMCPPRFRGRAASAR